jgi:DNA-binding beta-propeller fold protein YncE
MIRSTPGPVRSLVVTGALALQALPAPAHAATPTYAVEARWQLGGSGGWDYLSVDAATHRLFVSRGDHMEVVDTRSGALLGRIEGTAGVHDAALAPLLGRGYTSNGRANSVTEFDYTTLAPKREVPVPGQNPDTILFEPLHGHLYTFNNRSHDATVFDVATLGVLAQLKMPDAPEFAVDDGAGRIYVNIDSDPGQLVVIDAARMAITATWSLPGCEGPSGLALDRAGHRLFSVCGNKVMVVTDALGGRQLARLPIGARADGAAWDAGRQLAFSSNGEGTLTVVDASQPGRYAVAATLATQPGARTIALEPDSGRIFVVTADFGPVPPATAENPRPRAPPLPGTFTVLVVAPR